VRYHELRSGRNGHRADLIAAGLSPFRPSLVALSAGRLLLRELDRLASEGSDFAFESTLNGRTYVGRFER
jgi:predicted ABC-type ATPase